MDNPLPPITAQLRATVKRYNKYSSMAMPCPAVEYVKLDADTFDRMCDAIDAIHESLEGENESLLKKLSGATKVGRLELSVHVDLEQMAVDLERAADAIRTLEEKGGE